jgi:hypothetical protein
MYLLTLCVFHKEDIKILSPLFGGTSNLGRLDIYIFPHQLGSLRLGHYRRLLCRLTWSIFQVLPLFTQYPVQGAERPPGPQEVLVSLHLEELHRSRSVYQSLLFNCYQSCFISVTSLLFFNPDPFWSILVHPYPLDTFDLFCSTYAITIHHDSFWHIVSSLIHSNPFWSIVINPDPFLSILIRLHPF